MVDWRRLDPNGKKVWEYTESDFPADTNIEWVIGAHRLKNGNTLIMNWLGHGKNGKGISIIEVTPAKETVWAFKKPTVLNFARILD